MLSALGEPKEQELRSLKDKLHLADIERYELLQKLQKLEEAHTIAKDGNRALATFIHKRHRLHVKFEPGSIRSYLQQAEQNK